MSTRLAYDDVYSDTAMDNDIGGGLVVVLRATPIKVIYFLLYHPSFLRFLADTQIKIHILRLTLIPWEIPTNE